MFSQCSLATQRPFPHRKPFLHLLFTFLCPFRNDSPKYLFKSSLPQFILWMQIFFTRSIIIDLYNSNNDKSVLSTFNLSHRKNLSVRCDILQFSGWCFLINYCYLKLTLRVGASFYSMYYAAREICLRTSRIKSTEYKHRYFLALWYIFL